MMQVPLEWPRTDAWPRTTSPRKHCLLSAHVMAKLAFAKIC